MNDTTKQIMEYWISRLSKQTDMCEDQEDSDALTKARKMQY